MTLKRYVPGAILLMLVWTINIAAQETGGIGFQEPLNPIQEENLLPGTTEWMIPKGHEALNREIEGYASAVSVNVGETIQFLVNVPYIQRININVYRLGWYDGKGGNLVTSRWDVQVYPKALPAADPVTGLQDCHWTMTGENPASYSWIVPGDAVSGVYLAKISTVNNAFQSYIPFIIRNDARQSDFLFQTSVTTWQAYNVWPHNLGLELPETSVFQGKSLYWDPNSTINPGSWGPLVPVGVPGAERAGPKGIVQPAVSPGQPKLLLHGGTSLYPGRV